LNICIVNCFDTYEHRVDLLCDTFKELGHNVLILSSDFRHFEKCKRLEKKEGFIFFKTLPYVKNLSINRMKSHVEFSKDISKYIEQNINSFDLIWALIPPNSLVKDLSKIKKKYSNVKLIYDLIDLWPETMPININKNIFPFSYWKKIRDKHIKYADSIVTECNLYQNILQDVLKEKKVHTLYLARPLYEYQPNLHLPDDKISLCYLGSINNIIDIDVIVDIIKQINIIKPVEFHIIGDGERREELIDKSKTSGVEVIYHGKVYDRKEKQYILDGCHYGLNIMKTSVCVGLTMKSMDYFEFGLPIINNISGDTWNIVDNRLCGINVDNKMINFDYKYSDDMRYNLRNFFEEFLTEKVFRKNVFKYINELENK